MIAGAAPSGSPESGIGEVSFSKLKGCDSALDEADERISLSNRFVSHGCTTALSELEAVFSAGCGSFTWVEKVGGRAPSRRSPAAVLDQRRSWESIPPTTSVIVAAAYSPRSVGGEGATGLAADVMSFDRPENLAGDGSVVVEEEEIA